MPMLTRGGGLKSMKPLEGGAGIYKRIMVQIIDTKQGLDDLIPTIVF
jgi:hypothetical protein